MKKNYNIDIFFIMVFAITLGNAIVNRFDYSIYIWIGPIYFLVKGLGLYYIEYNGKETKRLKEKYED